MRVFITELKKNIISLRFVMSVLLLFLLCLMADAPSAMERVPLSILDEIVKFRRDYWIEKGSAFCSESVLAQFDNSIWYSIILPVIAAFPVVYGFYDEWFGDYYIFTLPKAGYKKYAFGKFSAAFCTGLLTAVCGILIFAAVVFIIFPSTNEYSQADWYTYADIYSKPCEMIIAKIINNAVLCGFYALSSLLIVLIIKDKFFTLSLFMVINYFSMKSGTKFLNSSKFLEGNNRAFRILFPHWQGNNYYLLPEDLKVSFYLYIPFILFICLIFNVISYFIIKRRYRYAS